ncbi:hypothetical protein FMM74_022070 [Lachnospiraceae bacterium MD308]|nr:hypothetical protein [Lachnospiraceae bacterium MD308]
MNEVLKGIDWTQIIYTVWTVILLPILTYIGSQISAYAKAKQIDKYTNILYQNVLNAVKDVYETVVKDIKGDADLWTLEKQEEVKELAKTKAIAALTTSAYQVLKTANEDFDEYLDGLIGTALYDIKNYNITV